MAYYISGESDSDGRIIIINENKWEVEKTKEIVSGQYEVGDLYGGNKTLCLRISDGKVLVYGKVNSYEKFLNKTLYVVGKNDSGQLGLGDTTHRSTFSQVGSNDEWHCVSTGGDKIVAIKNNGTMFSCGVDFFGQLGHGVSGVNRSTLTQIGSDSDWIDVKCGVFFSIAKKTDGTLYSWGHNNSGKLGLGTVNSESTPTKIGSDNDWFEFACGDSHVVAIKNDGTLHAFGVNSNGQLGMNNRTNYSTPTKIGTSSNWIGVSCGYSHTLSLETNGTLWGCGDNGGGQLGLGDIVNRSTLTQIGSTSNYKSISCGYSHSALISLDGSLWTCGANFYGQLGIGYIGHRSTPTKVGTNTDWKDVYCAYNSTFHVSNDNNMYGIGRNNYGQLGLNNTTQYPTPQLITTYSREIKFSGYNSVAVLV